MVIFDEPAHTYTNTETGKRYLSSTQLVGLFKEVFDTKGISERYAKKHGGTPEYWVQVWEDKKNRACERGTAFHKAKEDYINGRGLVVFKDTVHYAQNQEFFDHKNFPSGVYTEMLLWNDAYEIAGQSDIVIITPSKVVNSIHQQAKVANIDDHKTNGEIHTESYFNYRTQQHKMMLYPLDHLMDCSFVHYELQLSIYMYMLEMWGYEVGTLQFTHYPHDNEETGEKYPPVVYPLQYRKKEVLLMFNFHRINQQAA